MSKKIRRLLRNVWHGAVDAAGNGELGRSLPTDRKRQSDRRICQHKDGTVLAY